MVYVIGARVKHPNYGLGVLLGNKHKRRDGCWYWHVSYDDGTFGYNRESNLIIT